MRLEQGGACRASELGELAALSDMFVANDHSVRVLGVGVRAPNFATTCTA